MNFIKRRRTRDSLNEFFYIDDIKQHARKEKKSQIVLNKNRGLMIIHVLPRYHPARTV